MPLLKILTSAQMSEPKRLELVTSLSTLISEALGKPEKYVMVAIEHGEISIGGKAGPAAFVDIRNIGYLSGDTTQKISGRICSRLRELLAIPGDRVYLNFTDISPYNWGWNGKTFG